MTPTATRCSKRRFDTELEAIRGAIDCSKKWGKPMRHYPQGHPCECGGWHITSQIRDTTALRAAIR